VRLGRRLSSVLVSYRVKTIVPSSSLIRSLLKESPYTSPLPTWLSLLYT
jgi:hypothetical protein